MRSFHGTPVLWPDRQGDAAPHLVAVEHQTLDPVALRQAVARNQLALVRGVEFRAACALFGELVDHYDLRDSYDVQMQYVVNMMAAREAVEGVAVTVNRRGPYQMVQPHSEGDTTAPLELFGLYCEQDAASGGESVFGLVNQAADHSKLRAKEKAVLDRGLSPAELNKLRRNHLDAKAVIVSDDAVSRVLVESPHGDIVVRQMPVTRSLSPVSGEPLMTYWDNVTVHDHAFHRCHYELLNQAGIFHVDVGAADYAHYMHVEDDSAWGPADTDSGNLDETAALFACHVIYKMAPGELVVFNNRAWTHAANNWPPHDTRTLRAMYA
jgi:hypothetical protein